MLHNKFLPTLFLPPSSSLLIYSLFLPASFVILDPFPLFYSLIILSTSLIFSPLLILFPCWSSLALYLTIDLLPFVHTELIWYVEGCLSLYWFTIAPLLPTFSGFYSLSIYILFRIKMIFFPFFSVWCITMSSADTSLHEFFSFFGSKIYIVFPLPF